MSQGSEDLLLIDGEGRVLGRESKEACHHGQGLLHAAFLVLVFDETGSLLLARRSPDKKLWPGFWDGTVASHYLASADRAARIRDKVHQELGVEAADPEYKFRFQYQVSYRDLGSECELCDVYVLKGVALKNLRVNPAEISAFRTVGMETLKKEIAAGPSAFTPWFLIAFRRLSERDAGSGRQG